MNNRELVENYINNFNQSILIFNNCKEEIIFDNLDDLVLEVLRLARDYDSLNIDTNLIETCCGRRRSVLDIWRHCKFYNEEVIIYDVMRSIYNLCYTNKKSINGLYCDEIHRRTFRYVDYRYDFGYTGTISAIDEFGLLFEEWKDI